jgi:hypothetical protein
VDETPDQAATPARPSQPTTPEEIKRSLTIIRWAIAFSVVTIGLLTWIFIAFLDAPTVPLLPLAIGVIAIDFVMLAIFTRQRRQAIEKVSRERSGLPG